MPDLSALSRADLEAGAKQGLLHPLDGLTTLPDDPDWYPYAQQMAHVQNTSFGLPFAGDTLALIGYSSPLPTNWDELPEETLIIFPAADPQALFTLSLYLSSGGTLTNEEGLPAINESILAEVLSLVKPDPEIQVFSSSNSEYLTDAQAWEGFLDQRGNLTVSWVSNYLGEETTGSLTLAPVPGLTSESEGYTLGTGWSWALTGSNSDNLALAVELGEFLSDSSFLAEWSREAGVLPTRPTALSSWENTDSKVALAEMAESAYLLPSQELLNTIGPLFADATLAVLNGEQLPDEAANTVAEQLK
jgi:ABC-type glycerol-3-phosphate transport system substrate-binding protein